MRKFCYYLETTTLFFSNYLAIPFHILAKLWPNLADILIGLIIYRLLIRLKTKPLYASFWSLMFLLNPISLLISSAHGQIDSVTSLFVLLSIYFLTLKSNIQSYISALFLGFAIAIKPNPAIVLPLFIAYNYKKCVLKEKVVFISIIIIVVSFSLIPYIWQSFHEVLTNVFGYSGVYDLGYAAIFRSLWYQRNADYWLPLTKEFLDASKFLFLGGAILLTIIFAKSKNLVKACLAIYLLFLTVYFGISAQYLIWILPLAVLEKDRTVIFFSLSGLLALLGFYMFFGPEILLGKLSATTAFQSKYMSLYALGNLALWITTLFWLIKIIKNYLLISFNTFSPLHKKAILFSFVFFAISFLPVLQVIMRLISEFTR